MKRSQSDSTLLKVYVFDSHFYSKLMSCSDLMKWTKKVDLFEYDILFIPVHNVNHWSLAAVWSKPNEHSY
jgi:sentrin-specific protease 1